MNTPLVPPKIGGHTTSRRLGESLAVGSEAECLDIAIQGALLGRRLCIPDLQIVEEAVFAHAAEFHFRLGQVGDICWLPPHGSHPFGVAFG
jgi:hypothetical protein